MGARNNSWIFVSLLSFLFVFFFSSKTHHLITIIAADTDTLYVGQSLTGNQVMLTSNDGDFQLGLFSPGRSQKNYYMGIWYKGTISFHSNSVVWVANREQPFYSSFFSELKLKLLENGNLVLYDDLPDFPIWSTNSKSVGTLNSSKLVLGNDGNLVLRDVTNPSIVIWQSFDYQTNTWLPGGKIGFNKRTNKVQRLTSWRNEGDPSPGIFSLELDPHVQRQILIRWKRSQQVWASGSWNEQTKLFTSVPGMRSEYNFSYVTNENESYFTVDTVRVDNETFLPRFVLDISGQIKLLTWSDSNQEWYLSWSEPEERCDVYGICGSFGICYKHPFDMECDCLPGFEKRFPEDWGLKDTTGGCFRKTPLQCKGINDNFSLISKVKMPDNPHRLVVGSADECWVACTDNCSCNAYAYGSSSGCLSWGGDLLNLQLNSTGQDLYLRIAASDIETPKALTPSPSSSTTPPPPGKKKNISKFIIAILIITLGTITTLVIVLGYMYLIKKKANRKDKNKSSPKEKMLKNDDEENQGETPELQIFGFASLAIATNNFCLESKLGEGGFGPVYKGKLQSGQEIAVKRLSKSSGQGIKEFKSEVTLISKLNHRNLVKLLGCCTEEEENMLIYEYLPNKSLDAFLFDPRKRAQLDWNKRFNIIRGIARGLLYLHRDSRLRIIHRDLKVSNILLDKDMNPKISDFGIARIFGGNQTIATTNRVVGTFGYMSPEYVMGGTFSEKSDVFSYGVLILEILSGRRNTSFYLPDQPLNLLLHTWRLWLEGKWSEIVDQELGDSYSTMEVIRSIHVGLLCVQRKAVDRPTMSEVDFMLGSETERPYPKEPPFTSEISLESNILQNHRCTNNTITMSTFEGR